MSGIIFIESYMIWIENGNSRLILHLKMNFCGAMGYAARLAYIKPPHMGGFIILLGVIGRECEGRYKLQR